ncbi:hypothetical protein ADIS_1668 [Lunatimonas lonarensis]|uniref:Uncharacterized protein n=1 Tax=Lunatimonas lonarensis TaxID=1232681 RepID=R7ZUU3_9BACT|nr:hypothetical protein ADIS_1668 [Lunatimonas lonarensis]
MQRKPIIQLKLCKTGQLLRVFRLLEKNRFQSFRLAFDLMCPTAADQ